MRAAWRHLRLTITGRQRLKPGVRAHAEEKMRRLERHANLHDVSLVLDHDSRHVPAANAEVRVHIQHRHLTARADAGSVLEAIDRVVDKADEQIRRNRERATNHKSRSGADGESDHSRPASGDLGGSDGVVLERRARLRPMSLETALQKIDRRDLGYLLFLDEDTGDTCLLARRPHGGFDLVVADTR